MQEITWNAYIIYGWLQKPLMCYTNTCKDTPLIYTGNIVIITRIKDHLKGTAKCQLAVEHIAPVVQGAVSLPTTSSTAARR